MKQITKQTRNTLILIPAIVLIAALIFISQRNGSSRPTACVVIKSDSTEVMRLDLSEDTVVTIDSPYGGYNTVEIRDGEVFVKEADCDNQLCVNQGEIHDETEVIVCLPHRMVVSIEQGER